MLDFFELRFFSRNTPLKHKKPMLEFILNLAFPEKYASQTKKIIFIDKNAGFVLSRVFS